MKSEKSRFKRCFLLMLGFYSLSPLAFLIMPAADFDENGIRRILAYLVGILFWLGMIAGTVCLVCLNKMRKKNGTASRLPGVLSFFSCRQGKVIDAIFIPIAVLALIFTAVSAVPRDLSLVSYGAALFFGILHSAFNGKNYKYLIKKGKDENI